MQQGLFAAVSLSVRQCSQQPDKGQDRFGGLHGAGMLITLAQFGGEPPAAMVGAA
jgi:hypothetical protein